MKPYRRDRGSALAAVVIFAFILVGLAAAAWPVYSERNELRASKELDGQRIQELSARPTLEQLQITQASLEQAASERDSFREQLQRLQVTASAAANARDIAQADATAFEKQAAENRQKLSELEMKVDDLTLLNEERTKELAKARQNLADLREAARDNAMLFDKLQSAQTRLAELTAELATEKAVREEKELTLADCEQKLARISADLQDREENLDRLRRELSEIPIEPLKDEAAERKYRQYLEQVAQFRDRESRAAAFFRAKLALAGSSYEEKVDSLWRREIKRKQEDLDRAARLVLEDVESKIKVHPEAHDANVKLLEEARSKVESSERYTEIIKQLIDREIEYKAAGR